MYRLLSKIDRIDRIDVIQLHIIKIDHSRFKTDRYWTKTDRIDNQTKNAFLVFDRDCRERVYVFLQRHLASKTYPQKYGVIW